MRMNEILNYLFPPSNTANPVLAQKLKGVENRLKGANRFLKSVNLNALPWYLLIGSTGAGKTTLLANSGIKYILDKKIKPEDQRVMPHSGHCDWWITPNAVIIDVPGNYITYKPKMVSLPNKLWRQFLSLTQKARGRHALNGAVIAISLSELMEKEHRERLIQNLAHRIDELRDKFGADLPFYFTITKCDLLPGFLEFFSDYGSNELAQAWGVPFHHIKEGDSLPDVFNYWFNGLIKRVNQQLISSLHKERNAYTKVHIKDFPLQLERLKEGFDALLKGLMREKTHSFCMKGVYLTSGHQSSVTSYSSSHQQIVLTGESQKALAILEAPAMPSQAYFIKQFILQVLVPELRLKRWTLKWQASHLAYAFMGSLIIMLAIYFI